MIRESRNVDGAPLWIFHDALPDHDVAALTRELQRAARGELLGYTRNARDIAEEVGGVLAKGSGLQVHSWSPIVTYGRAKKPLGWHFDHHLGSKWKLFAYLNAPAKGGGTIFGRRSSSICIPPAPGTVVLFSVEIEHRGEAQPADFEKLTIGVRPLKLTLPT